MNGSRMVGLVVFVCVSVPLLRPALADGARAEKLLALQRKLAAIEGELRVDDADSINDHIAGIERILNRYQGPQAVSAVATPAQAAPTTASATPMTCVSNGESGPYERFAPTDASSGTAFGAATGLATCKQLLAVRNADLMCVSNGEGGAYEQFGVYDAARKVRKGGYTSLNNCQQLVSKARGNFVCQSNGESGAYERFHLYNREADKVLGGDTTLAQCLGAIPN